MLLRHSRLGSTTVRVYDQIGSAMSTVIPQSAPSKDFLLALAERQKDALAKRDVAKYESGDAIESSTKRTVYQLRAQNTSGKRMLIFNARKVVVQGVTITVYEQTWMPDALVAKHNITVGATVVTDGLLLKGVESPSGGLIFKYTDALGVVQDYAFPRINVAFVESTKCETTPLAEIAVDETVV